MRLSATLRPLRLGGKTSLPQTLSFTVRWTKPPLCLFSFIEVKSKYVRSILRPKALWNCSPGQTTPTVFGSCKAGRPRLGRGRRIPLSSQHFDPPLGPSIKRFDPKKKKNYSNGYFYLILRTLISIKLA